MGMYDCVTISVTFVRQGSKFRVCVPISDAGCNLVASCVADSFVVRMGERGKCGNEHTSRHVAAKLWHKVEARSASALEMHTLMLDLGAVSLGN